MMNLYLIDGNSYIYRAYYAIKKLSNSKGFPTNAIYGFTNMLLKIIREKKPDALCIVFDSPVPTERHKLYEEYKAQRPEMPKDLILQIPFIKKIIEALKIPVYEMPGQEADDVICTIAKKSAVEGASVYIVTGDKDMMQALSVRIKIYDPMKDSVIDETYVREKFGLPPERMPEFMAITGDTVDNIPGVKGIGEKTAKDLLLTTGSLHELINHPEKIKNQRIRKMIADSIENIKLSKILATINSELPIEMNMHDMTLKEPDWQALLPLFTEFEFRSLIKLIPIKGSTPRGKYITVRERGELLRFLGKE